MDSKFDATFLQAHADLWNACAAVTELSLPRTPADLNSENVPTIRALANAVLVALGTHGDVSDLIGKE